MAFALKKCVYEKALSFYDFRIKMFSLQ